MAVVINSNLAALTARKNLELSQSSLSLSIARLSSGMRITKAADDAAGLAISEKLNASVRGLAQASRNAGNGISVVATAEGAMVEITSSLVRMRELAVQAASGDLGSAERGNLNSEFAALKSEIDRIASATQFNGTSLLTATSSITIQIGTGNNSNNDQMALNFSGLNTTSLSLNSSDISTAANASSVLTTLDTAIGTVTTKRGDLGAMQNRLESVIRNLSVSIENTTAANSRIRDVDVAEETASYTKNQILVQAGVSVLSQANQQPSIALSLLK